MTQTVKDQDDAARKRGRPGQRQQERLQRLARRHKRRQIALGVLVTVVLLTIVGVSIWQYQLYTTHQQALIAAASATADTKAANIRATADAKAAAARATADAKANLVIANATATALVPAILTATTGSPTPSAGPTTPPQVTETGVKLADGLQYIDLKVGPGPIAQKGSTISVEYTGWLESTGKKFDSSYDHGGTPFSVILGQGKVIPGWDEGLIGVRAGGTRRLIIPATLAYGAQGSGPIPPNAVLIFDVTVLTVQ